MTRLHNAAAPLASAEQMTESGMEPAATSAHPDEQGTAFWQLQGAAVQLSSSTATAHRIFNVCCHWMLLPGVGHLHFLPGYLLRACTCPAGLYIASLLQTGRLMEASASPEEALWSFQEAVALVFLGTSFLFPQHVLVNCSGHQPAATVHLKHIMPSRRQHSVGPALQSASEVPGRFRC